MGSWVRKGGGRKKGGNGKKTLGSKAKAETAKAKEARGYTSWIGWKFNNSETEEFGMETMDGDRKHGEVKQQKTEVVISDNLPRSMWPRPRKIPVRQTSQSLTALLNGRGSQEESQGRDEISIRRICMWSGKLQSITGTPTRSQLRHRISQDCEQAL